MTRLRSILLSALGAALCVTGAASESFATEPGDFTNYLRGATRAYRSAPYHLQASTAASD
jgi:hypothetical protein